MGDKCWVNHLNAAIRGYNITIHAGILITPFEAFFGRPYVTNVMNRSRGIERAGLEEEDASATIERTIREREELNAYIQGKQEESACKMKAQVEKQNEPILWHFTVGSWVQVLRQSPS
jgi:hypothetical protein